MRDTKTQTTRYRKIKLGLRPTAKAKRARKEYIMNAQKMTVETTRSTAATYFYFDHFNQKIHGSELNFKKAGNPSTAQYAALMAARELQPTYAFAPIAPAFKKQTYKGLNFELMMDYVQYVGNADQKAEFDEIVNSNAHFPTIKSWFTENFKAGFTVEKAKREIENAKKKIAQAELTARKAKVRATVRAKATSANVDTPNVINF